MAQRTAGVTHARGRTPSDHDPDPKVIAARIERTRGEITKTIAAIAERLSPERLVDEAMGAATKLAGQAEATATKMAVEAEAAATKMAHQAETAADDAAKDALAEADAAVRTLTE